MVHRLRVSLGKRSKSLKYLVLNMLFWAVILGLLFLHFLYLQADFPKGITWSGELLTDEGWWSNNATAYTLTGKWYVEGDYNPAVNLPVFPLVQAITFRLMGLSILSARGTILFFFVLLLFLVYLLVKKYISETAAKLAIFILLANYLLFAYSRLALLEIPMTFFVLLAIYFSLNFAETKRQGYIILSAVSFTLMVLTKTTAVFALPILMGILVGRKVPRQTWLQQFCCLMFFAVIASMCFLIYYFGLVRSFPLDFYNFTKTTTINNFRGLQWLAKLMENLQTGFFQALIIDKVLCVITVLVSLLVLLIKELRQNILARISVAWIYLYILGISISGYTPPRYYVPVIIPIAILVALMFNFLLINRRRRIGLGILIILLTISSYGNLAEVSRYIRQPDYSLVEMENDIKAYVDRQRNSNRVLLGTFANTISLQTGIFSINEHFGTKDLAYKIRKYQPGYYVSLGKMPSGTQQQLTGFYSIKLIRQYDVMGNYYTGEPIYFYELISLTKV